MKFTLSWLRDHLETTEPLEKLTGTLSAIGLEVEGVTDPAAKLGAFRVARILEAKKHPNADKLQVCQVEIAPGEPPLEVVCGAPNAKAGLLVVFAPLGTFIPGSGITLEKKPVRGVVSNGMLCSAAELELAGENDGIIALPEEFADQVGARYVDAVGLADPVIEVKLTPNRPDCTGVRGMARDLAAAGLGTLKPLEPIVGVEGREPCPIAIHLEFPDDAANACPIFAGRLIEGVENGPSPAWLKTRLEAVGLRPINALVDVTNLISLDRGRPLHVYDADKLNGAIRARLGREGESFEGLDGKPHAVDGTMCVIADDSGPLGLGGILGGATTGCTDATTNVFIESAWFDPVRTARTGRTAGIASDARYRFERGVDPASVRLGLDMATRMILDLTGGKPSQARIAGRAPDSTRVVPFDMARVEQLTGVKLGGGEMRVILDALGFVVAGKGSKVKVTVPSWRPDVHGPADLVEEIVRIAGLDRIPATPLPMNGGPARGTLTDRQKRTRRARRLLAARGCVEAVTWSFISRTEAVRFGGGMEELSLANPIASDLSDMRPSLLPGLLAAVARNRNRGVAHMALFELGQVFRGEHPEDQGLHASGLRAGAAQVLGTGRHWEGAAKDAGLFDVKADAFALLAALGFDPARAELTRDAPAWYHPGRSAVLRLGPKVVLAQFGEVHPKILGDSDIAGPVAAFEVFLDDLPPEKTKGCAKPSLPAADLLPVRRDFAFVLKSDVSAEAVIRAATNADKALIGGVSVFDLFADESLARDGKKSLAIEVTLQPTIATLTDADIETVSRKIVNAVTKTTGGEIRS